MRGGCNPATLQAGGAEAEAQVTRVLESSLEVIEALMITTPRKQRKALNEQRERLETILEGVDTALVWRLATCETAKLTQLSEKLAAITPGPYLPIAKMLSRAARPDQRFRHWI